MKKLKCWIRCLLFIIAGLSSIVKQWMEAHPKSYFWIGTGVVIMGLVEWCIPMEYTTPKEDLIGILCCFVGFLFIAAGFSPQMGEKK